MRFELKAECVFSGDLGPAEEEIRGAISRAAPTLMKGAPRGKEGEAARVEGWGIQGRKLKLSLTSGRYVRAHDAVFRLLKILSAELGGKYRLGLRDVKGLEYRIFLPAAELPARARQELRTLPCEVEVDDRGVTLTLRNLSESDLRGRVADRLISMAQEVLSRPPATAIPPKVVGRAKPIEHPFKLNPFEEARRLGWVLEFPGRGQWIYMTPYAELLRALEDLIVEEIALPLGFREAMFPKLIPLKTMQKMPGYLDSMPEGMYYVCPPPRDPGAFEGFKQRLRLTRRLPADELERCLKGPAYVLAPAQCEPFYEMFSRRHVRLEDLPVKLFDRSGWTYRWEGGGVEGFIRTQEFRRIELVFLAEPGEAVEIRDAVLQRSIKLAEDLGLEWRSLAATPFYMREGGIEEDVSDSSKVAAYDLEVRLPYKDEWLEVSSYNVHRTKFVETFKIKEAKGRDIWTGCCGFGTTRWTAGFLAQHGFDGSSWPELVRARIRPRAPERR